MRGFARWRGPRFRVSRRAPPGAARARPGASPPRSARRQPVSLSSRIWSPNRAKATICDGGTKEGRRENGGRGRRENGKDARSSYPRSAVAYGRQIAQRRQFATGEPRRRYGGTKGGQRGAEDARGRGGASAGAHEEVAHLALERVTNRCERRVPNRASPVVLQY